MIEKRPVLRTQSAITLQDVYHVLFRHKWKIALLCSLGLIGALLVRITSFVPYQSEAKLYIRYVVDSKSPTQMGGTDSRVKSTCSNECSRQRAGRCEKPKTLI